MQGQGSAKGKRRHPGIESRHTRTCGTRAGGNCNCKPTYRAWVYDRRTGEKVRKTFDRLDDARAWRADATVGLRKGTMRSPSRITLNEAADSWLEGVKVGTIRNRSGDAYKPSAIRGYEAALRRKLRPARRRASALRNPACRHPRPGRPDARGRRRPLDDPQRAHAAPCDLPARDSRGATSRSTRRLASSFPPCAVGATGSRPPRRLRS